MDTDNNLHNCTCDSLIFAGEWNDGAGTYTCETCGGLPDGYGTSYPEGWDGDGFSPRGQFGASDPCEDCMGTGNAGECYTCGGSGRLRW